MDFRDNNRLVTPEVASLNEPSGATRRHQGAKCFPFQQAEEKQRKRKVRMRRKMRRWRKEEGTVNNDIDNFLCILTTHQLLSF